MRIGLITYDFDPPIGGLGLHVKRLLHALPHDLSVTVLSPSANASVNVSSFAKMRWNKRGGCPVFSFTLLWSLTRFIRTHQIDILHVQSGSGGVFLLVKPSAPLIVTAHHTYIDEVHLVFKNPVKKMIKWIMSRLEKRTYTVADRIICVSADTASSLIKHYRIDAQKIVVIENSIDVHRFKVMPQRDRDPAHLLFIGRLEERKGVDVLLQAFLKLALAYPELALTLAGANLMGEWIPCFIKEHALGGRVHLPGQISDEQMMDLLATKTILVVPSRLEGFGLIAAEGMAAGIPVLISDTPGLRSIVRDGETGRIFRDDCASILEEMLHDRASLEKISQRAREEALVRFDPTRQAQEMGQIYTSL